jgi:uncharacterized metal-binding protein YceD (DUF177 family)
MALLVNVQRLQRGSSLKMEGELSVEELGITGLDDCISPELPLKYDLELTMSQDGILLQGCFDITVRLTCVRCLREYQKHYQFENWSGFAVLQGEDAMPVDSDCVDLTPLIREDILLAFPLHPACEGGCSGPLKLPVDDKGSDTGFPKGGSAPSVWDELDKLKL